MYVQVLNATNHARTSNHRTKPAQTHTIPHIDAKLNRLSVMKSPPSVTMADQNEPFVYKTAKDC